MNAITLLQPWALAICHLGKRIENRTWRPWAGAIGKPLAIHAGKGWDEAGAEWIWENFGVRYAHHDAPKGCVVAVAHLSGFLKAGNVLMDRDREIYRRQRKWFAGPFGWILEDLRVIDRPVFCRGKQGIWTLGEVVRLDVMRQALDVQTPEGVAP